MNDDYKPRFSFEITEEQRQRTNELMSIYGIRKSLMGIILDDLLDLIEEHGSIVIGIILDHAAKPRDILSSIKDVGKIDKRGKDGNN